MKGRADAPPGITKGVWVHIPGRKSSRPEHVAFNGQEFDLRKGLWNAKTQTWDLPGIPINCSCSYRPLFEFDKWNNEKN